MSWPFLAKPSEDPGAVGLLSLRLETSWFASLDGGSGAVWEFPEMGGAEEEACGSEASGGRQGPSQWGEERAVNFIQVFSHTYYTNCVLRVY